MAYKSSEGPSCLFMGDERGEVTGLKFLQPKNGLLRRKFNDRISLFYWTVIFNEYSF